MSLSIPQNRNSIFIIQNDQGTICNMEIRNFLNSGEAMLMSIADNITSSKSSSGPNFGLQIVYERSKEDIALLDSNDQIFIFNFVNNNYRKVYKSDHKVSALSFTNSHPNSLLISLSAGDILRLDYNLADNSSVIVKSKFKITSMASHPSDGTSVMCSRLSNKQNDDLVSLWDNRSLQCLSILEGHREVVCINYEFDGFVIVVLFKEDGAYFYHTFDHLYPWCHCGNNNTSQSQQPSNVPEKNFATEWPANGNKNNNWSSYALTHDNKACILAADLIAKLMVYSLPELGMVTSSGHQRTGELECYLLAIIDLYSHYISVDNYLSVLLPLPKSSKASGLPSSSSAKPAEKSSKSVTIYDFIGLTNNHKLIFLRLLFERKSDTESPTLTTTISSSSSHTPWEYPNNSQDYNPVHYIVAMTYEPIDISAFDHQQQPPQQTKHPTKYHRRRSGNDSSSSREDSHHHNRILVTKEGMVVVITPDGQLLALHPLSVFLSPTTTSTSTGHRISPIQLSVQLCQSSQTKVRYNNTHQNADNNNNNTSSHEEKRSNHSQRPYQTSGDVSKTKKNINNNSILRTEHHHYQDSKAHHHHHLQQDHVNRKDEDVPATTSIENKDHYNPNDNLENQRHYQKNIAASENISSPNSSSSSGSSHRSGHSTSTVPPKNTKEDNGELHQQYQYHHQYQYQYPHLGKNARTKSKWKRSQRGYFTEEPFRSNHLHDNNDESKSKDKINEQCWNKDNIKEGLLEASFSIGVTVKKLKKYFDKYAVYPTPYRGLVWRLLLELPENTLAFSELEKRGMYPNFEHLFSDLFTNTSNRKVIQRLRRICSCVAHWSPVMAELSHLPKLILPLLSVYPSALQDIFVFEMAVTILMHWGRGWLATHPHPPAHLLDIADISLETLDPPLHRHFGTLGINTGSLVWGMMTSLLSEILHPTVWQSTMDLLFSNTKSPELLLIAAIAILNILRNSLLSATKASHILGFLREEQGIDYDNLRQTITAIRCRKDKVVLRDASDNHSSRVKGNVASDITVKMMFDIIGGKSPSLIKSKLSTGAQRMISLYESMTDYAGSSVFPLPKGGYPAFSGYPEVFTHRQNKQEFLASQLRESIMSKLQNEHQIDSLIASVLHSNYTQQLEAVTNNLKQREISMIELDNDYLREMLKLEQEASIKKQAKLEDIQTLLMGKEKQSSDNSYSTNGLPYESECLRKVSEREELLEAIKLEKERSIAIETKIVDKLQYFSTNRPDNIVVAYPSYTNVNKTRTIVKEGLEECTLPNPPNIHDSTNRESVINSLSDNNSLHFTSQMASNNLLASKAANRYQSSKATRRDLLPDSSHSSNSSKDNIISNSTSSSIAATRSTSSHTSPTISSSSTTSASSSSSHSKVSSVSVVPDSDSITVSSSSSHSPPVSSIPHNIVSMKSSRMEQSKDPNTSVNVNQNIPPKDKIIDSHNTYNVDSKSTHSHPIGATSLSLNSRISPPISIDYSAEAQRRQERVTRLLQENEQYYTPSNSTSIYSGSSNRRIFSDSDYLLASRVGKEEVKGETISPPTPSDETIENRNNNIDNTYYLVNKSGSFAGSDVDGVRSASTTSNSTTTSKSRGDQSSTSSNNSINSQDEHHWDAFKQQSLRRPLPISLSPYQPTTNFTSKTETRRSDNIEFSKFGNDDDSKVNRKVTVTFGLPSKNSALRKEIESEDRSRYHAVSSSRETTMASFTPQRSTWEIKSYYDRINIPKEFEFSRNSLESVSASMTSRSHRNLDEDLLNHLYDIGDATLHQKPKSVTTEQQSFSYLDALSELEEYQHGTAHREEEDSSRNYYETEAIRRNKRRLHGGPGTI